MKAEHRDGAVAAIAHRFALVAAAHRMTGILQHREAITLGQRSDRCHIAAAAREMHWYHNFWQGSLLLGLLQLLLQCRHTHQAGGGIDVDKIDFRAAVATAVG